MGRLLGIDYGKKRIGLAITDELRMVASPHDTYLNNAEFLGKLQKLQEKYRFDAVVLGYPHSDTYRESSAAVEAFAEILREKLKIDVIFQNEEFTTVYMESFLKSLGYNEKQIKERIDRFAAQKILSDYLKLRQ